MNFGKKSIKTLLMLLCVLMFLAACTSQPGNTKPTVEPDNEPEANNLTTGFVNINTNTTKIVEIPIKTLVTLLVKSIPGPAPFFLKTSLYIGI